MSFINNLFISVFCKKIGEDQLHNKYYEGKKKDYLGHNKRYIIYKDKPEPSKIPPLWHAWVHCMINDVPVNYFVGPTNYLQGFNNDRLSCDLISQQRDSLPSEQNRYNKWQPSS